MAIFPVAVHTFDFVRVYVSQRDGSAPGSGVWSNPVKIFDGVSDPGESFSGTANTFSAGALSQDLSEPRGIVAKDGAGGGATLMFLGNGLPDLPKAITWGSGNTIGSVDYWDVSQGAFTPTNGALYLVGVDESVFPFKLLVLKSTDNGTTWTQMDAANAPGTNAIGAIQRVDDVVYFFSSDSSAVDYFITKFDTATDLFTSPIATLASAPISDFGQSRNTWSNSLFVFPNGDYGIIYDSSNSGTPVYRLYSGSWGAEITLPGITYANSVLDPSLELIHAWSYDTTSRDSSVHYSTVAHAGTVTPDIFIIPAPSGINTDGVGKCSIQLSMIFCPRDDSADFDNSVWVALLSDGQFQKELLPIPTGESDAIATTSLASGGSGYAAFDSVSVNGGIYPALITISGVAVGGAVKSFSGSGGTGYSTGTNIGTATGGGQPGIGTGFRVDITSVGGGGTITGAALNTAGSGYAVNDTGIISGGGGNATYLILSVYVNGGVQSYSVDDKGGGYSVASSVATTNISSSGSGFTINILSLIGKTPSCAYMMFPNGYSLSAPPPPGPLSIACPVSGTGTVGVPYLGMIMVTGGTPPYHYELI